MQRLNFHRENILDHRDRHTHYNRKMCDLARATVPGPWRVLMPPREAIFQEVYDQLDGKDETLYSGCFYTDLPATNGIDGDGLQ